MSLGEGELRVEGEGALVGLGGSPVVARVVEGDPEVVLRADVPRVEDDRALEAVRRLGELPLLVEAGTLGDERLRLALAVPGLVRRFPGRRGRAGGEEHGRQEEREQTRSRAHGR